MDDPIHLKLRFLEHATVASERSIYVAERLLECVVYGEAWTYRGKVLLHATDKIRAFNCNSLRRKCEK